MSLALAARAEWGNVAEWVAAAGTLLALIFAAVAAVVARNAYRIETERDQVNAAERARQEAFARRAQAALVSAWWGSRTTPGGTEWGAFVRNASETPVYSVRLSVVCIHDADIGEVFDVAVAPPAAEPVLHPSELPAAPGAELAAGYRVEMTFTDSAGNRWIRDQQGRLAELLPQVTIWADTQRATVLDTFAADFLASHDVEVRFHTHPIETLRERFVAAVRAGEPADVLIGPHDWLGTLVAEDVVEPIPLAQRRRAAFTDRALQAMTYDGQLYGVPYAADSILLLRNLELAPDPPQSVEEMLDRGRELCRSGRAEEPVALQVGEGDCFYVYPLFASAGGRLLDHGPATRWDRAAMTGAGSAAAFRRLRELGERGTGMLRREITRERAIELFAHGRTPYLFCAPWGIGRARASGVPVGASEVPPFADGAPTRSLVAVHGLYLARDSGNKTIAQDLIAEYLTRTDVALALYRAQPRTPALRSALEHVRSTDPIAEPFHRQFEVGDLIPAAPQTAAVFAAFHRAEVDVVAGKRVARALRRMARALSAAGTDAG